MRPRPARVAFAAWLVLVTALLLAPGSAAPSGPGVPGLDKVAHAALFAVLAALAAGAFPATRTVRLGLLLAAYALGTEAAQALVPDRSADAWDLLADAAGIVAGLALVRSRT